jgi:hypothetical protein
VPLPGRKGAGLSGLRSGLRANLYTRLRAYLCSHGRLRPDDRLRAGGWLLHLRPHGWRNGKHAWSGDLILRPRKTRNSRFGSSELGSAILNGTGSEEPFLFLVHRRMGFSPSKFTVDGLKPILRLVKAIFRCA